MDWCRARLTINLQATFLDRPLINNTSNGSINLMIAFRKCQPLMFLVFGVRTAFREPTRRGVASSELANHQAVQRWLKALHLAPCLECGQNAPPFRVNCPTSGFPLTCSSECAQSALSSRCDVVNIFQTIREDIFYARSGDAAKLLSKVSKPLNRGRPTSALVTDWPQFLRQKMLDEEVVSDERAQRLVSAAYTFVMTLAKFLLPDLTSNQGGDVLLHIVGARAEAMMPHYIWDELGWHHPQYNFSIKLIGDQVAVMPKRKQQVEHFASVRLQNWPGLYHMIPHVTPPDAFVLFNPGIGHPHLRDSWQPTLEMMMVSGRPILITSFSEQDQARDLEALRHLEIKTDIKFIVKQQSNPFGSLTYQLDPECVFSPIRTNSYVMIVRGSV